MSQEKVDLDPVVEAIHYLSTSKTYSAAQMREAITTYDGYNAMKFSSWSEYLSVRNQLLRYRFNLGGPQFGPNCG